MKAVAVHKKTVADYLRLPEGARYQLLDGELVDIYALKHLTQNRIHQELLLELCSALHNHVKAAQSGKVYIAPFDVYLDDDNVVQPDICFFATARLQHLSDRGAEAAPDVVIELLSPSNAYYDLRYKLELYERFGVAEYFIADPEDNTVLAYRLVDGKYKEQYREKGILRSGVLATDITW